MNNSNTEQKIFIYLFIYFLTKRNPTIGVVLLFPLRSWEICLWTIGDTKRWQGWLQGLQYIFYVVIFQLFSTFIQLSPTWTRSRYCITIYLHHLSHFRAIYGWYNATIKFYHINFMKTGLFAVIKLLFRVRESIYLSIYLSNIRPEDRFSGFKKYYCSDVKKYQNPCCGK